MTQDFDARLDPADEARLISDIRQFPAALQRSTRTRIGEAARPIGIRIVQEVAPQLPRRGGLAFRVAGARGTVSTRTGLRTAGVTLAFTRPRVLRYIDRGEIPHPVYARGPRQGWTWRTQPIRAGLVTQAFERNEPEARRAVEKAVTDAARTIRAGEVRP